MTVKVTTKAFGGKQRRGCPNLWQIYVDGVELEGGRVLKMGRRYLAVYDGGGIANHGSFESRREAAHHVVRFAN